MMRIPGRKRCATGWSVAVCCAAIIGCSGEKGTRHQISGTVTFRGNPVEHGTIAFDPDESVGAGFAPSSYAHIENGKYSVTLDVLIALATALNIPLKQLLDFQLPKE